MQPEIKQFLTYLTTEKGASAHTISAYRNDLTQFRTFCADQSRGLAAAAGNGANGNRNGLNGHANGNGAAKSCDSVDAVDANMLTAYVAHLREQGYAQATVARKVAAVKSFFGYLAAEDLVAANPAREMPAPRVGRSLPRALSIDEVDALLEQPGRKDTPEAQRDRAMLELLYATGVRVSEFVNLDLTSVELRNGSASVRCIGKGDKERLIPIHDAAVSALCTYLEQSRPKLARRRGERALFVNRRGERLTRQGIWLILKNYAKDAGIDDVTPHTLRHSFATHMLRGRAPLRSVQELMGHANISTTQIYTQLTDDHIREVYDHAHPRAS